MKTLRIRALLFKDSGWWCAQCLEYDIAAQAKTVPELRAELERILHSHVVVSVELGREPFLGLPRAPQRFFELFDASSSPIEDDEPLISASDAGSLPAIRPMLRFANA